MKKFLFVSGLVGVLVLAGLLVASNMGFKLTYTLHATAGATGTNWVSLPYYWSGTQSTDVCNEATNATEVGKYNEATDNFTSHTCPITKGQTPFALTEGAAVYVKVSADNSDWVIVGSHDPSYALTLASTAGATGTNWVSVPYHTTASQSSDICTEIANATEVGKYNEGTDTFTSHTCPITKGQTPFAMTPGEGIYLKVNTNGTTWTPAHY